MEAGEPRGGPSRWEVGGFVGNLGAGSPITMGAGASRAAGMVGLAGDVMTTGIQSVSGAVSFL